MISINDLTQQLSVSVSGGGQLIAGLAIDSRKVEQDYLYIALQGEQVDGNDFIDEAKSKGAVALATELPHILMQKNMPGFASSNLRQQLGYIASEFYACPSKSVNITAITGTNGKTSTAHFIQQIYKKLNQRCAIVGTLGMSLGDQNIDTVNTTPDAISFQAFLQQVKSEACENLVLEASSHALVQGRLNGTAIDCAIFTNLTHDHLDYHKTMDAYYEAKRQLFEFDSLTTAVINIDDDFGVRLYRFLSNQSKVKPFLISLRDPQANLFCHTVCYSTQGIHVDMQLNFEGKEERQQLLLPFIGEFNIYNSMLAAAKFICDGFSLTRLQPALESLDSVLGRMQLIPHTNITAVVDYAHTPDALENILLTLSTTARQSGSKLIVVFGCGGDRDQSKRPLMAAVVDKYADLAIVTDDNPRYESSEAIIEQIVSGFSFISYQVIADRAAAIRRAVEMAQQGDVLLVAGKGHEQYQIVNGVQYDFSDQQVLRDALDNVCGEASND
ncbi:MAG: UDP-N-acetylmuramoyl-L-alanyl-D-glutamate--2,6-diaminopimelate ligase [Pseudomonadales bacterium]|nr:UDP-N-acetylmuramoyl-L-alanyl-D-glutamate--2,6-diaminopimelate ligase [Pseudomonadales bacterium]